MEDLIYSIKARNFGVSDDLIPLAQVDVKINLYQYFDNLSINGPDKVATAIGLQIIRALTDRVQRNGQST